ncbi:hypothetical protein Tco_0590932 [Tanacetum coccineum]
MIGKQSLPLDQEFSSQRIANVALPWLIPFVLLLFDTPAGNPIKKILLKLNLSDHRLILTDSKEYLKMVMEVPDSS